MVTIPLKIQLSKNPVKSKHESESIPRLGNEGILLERLSQWTISGIGLHPGGSNYVFVVRLIDPEATQETIDEEGWLHTGDIGILDQNGYIKITDRSKDMFIVGGFNAYPAEIENILCDHPAISQAAVIGIADERMGEVAKAFVVLKPNHALQEDTLAKWSKENMANYKVPREIEFVDALPTNAAGKVMKYLLKEN